MTASLRACIVRFLSEWIFSSSLVREIRSRVFCKNGGHESFPEFIGKLSCQSLFWEGCRLTGCNFIKKGTPREVFSRDLLKNTPFKMKFLRASFSLNISGRQLSLLKIYKRNYKNWKHIKTENSWTKNEIKNNDNKKWKRSKLKLSDSQVKINNLKLVFSDLTCFYSYFSTLCLF